MAKGTRVTQAQLKSALRGEFEALMKEVTAAVNDAPAGVVIAGSEFRVRNLLAKFREKVYEKAIQLRSEAAEAAFLPSGECGPKTGP